MRASASLVVDLAPTGRSRLLLVRPEPPLVPRRTGVAADGAVVVHLVGAAAGPLGGDRLALDIEVRAGAALEIRTVAATVALPGRDGAGSRYAVTARVAAGATLRWLPQPLVAAAGCRHASTAAVDVAAGGRLRWRDVLVCGRHGETPGDLRSALSARYAGRPLLDHELAVGPAAPGWAGAAVLGGAGAVGSVLLIGGDLPAHRAEGTSAVFALAGPGVLACATGADAVEVATALDRLCSSGRASPDR